MRSCSGPLRVIHFPAHVSFFITSLCFFFFSLTSFLLGSPSQVPAETTPEVFNPLYAKSRSSNQSISLAGLPQPDAQL
eukprot:m.141284 g.141284  ORF g.141284 m.141284 type:complete len:78 (-) comp15976_c0_seq1:436-669(-)